MAKLKFEIYVNDVFLHEVASSTQLVASKKIIETYLDTHPEIDKETAKVSVNIKREPCKNC